MAVKFEDYYKVLGVERDASPKEIQAAFRKLARKYHPDVNKESDAEKKFKSINEAYEVLKDPEKKKNYDQLGANWQGGQDFTAPPGWQNAQRGGYYGGSGGSEDFSDFFEMFFGGQRSSGHRNWAQKGGDQESELTISLEDAYFGTTKTVALQRGEEQPDGRIISSRKEFQVKIPAGIKDGSRIRLKGQGSPGSNGGAAGDLYFKINIAPHEKFTLEDTDLKTFIEVSPWEAILGAKVMVPTMEGAVSINIPPGTQAGQKFRLKGKGLAKGSGKGNLYGEIKVIIPTNLNEEEMKLVQQLAHNTKSEDK